MECKEKTCVQGWWGYSICGRPCKGTYERYAFAPTIEVDERFKDIHTLKDVQRRMMELSSLIFSPTACTFDIDLESGLFYCDQQGCLLWYYDEQKGVYTQDKFVVALTLPEFLTRLYIESRIWLKRSWGNHKKLTVQEEAYVNALQKGTIPIKA